MKGLSIFIIVLCLLAVFGGVVLPVMTNIWARTIRKIQRRR